MLEPHSLTERLGQSVGATVGLGVGLGVGGFEAADILAASSEELLFEGSLMKRRFEVSRLYKIPWKLRFLRLYPNRLEYGKWNTKGRLVLRRGSPIHLNYTLTVSVESEGYGKRCNPREL